MTTTSQSTPKVAMIGCGFIGLKRLRNLPPGTVTMACDLNVARAEQLALEAKNCQFTDSVEKAVQSPNVDVVMVATVNSSLAPIACQALQAGKHVLVEKPGAISTAELEKIEALAREHSRLVRFGYNHRYHPAGLKAREIIDSGRARPPHVPPRALWPRRACRL